tara:strand:- start:9144 stop:9371 length:228 start_codon:yes stop_codon:yes gene_type:complete
MSKDMSKTDKFKKYANLRLKTTLLSLHRLGNLYNKKSFEYSEEDMEKIIHILDDAVQTCKKKLKSQIKYDKDFFE